ncbi:MAG: preprotein translocase subunit SecG [Bacteroidales bacterium]|nr:preprotein translocase subunit SecG [Bacteroidales bacterium]
MFPIISILIFIVAILLILIVLVQNSKGGGLAANFTGGGNMGVRKTADFLEKATWTLASILLVLSIAASATISTGGPTTNTQEKNLDALEVNQLDVNQIQEEQPGETPGNELQF